jgi:hypothetical protein
VRRIKLTALHQTIGAVRLYESDLAEILDLIGGEDTDITIAQGDAVFDDFADCRRETGLVHRRLSLQAEHKQRWGYVNVNFRDTYVDISANEGCEVEFLRVKDFLLSRRRPTGRISPEMWQAIAVAAAAAMTALAFLLRNHPLWMIVVPAPAIAYILFARKPLLENKLILARKHEHQNFFERHSDNIWRLVFAVVGTIIGALVTTYLKK